MSVRSSLPLLVFGALPYASRIVWRPPEEPWQYRVLDALPSGIDEAQLRAAREMTPTERLRAVMRLVELGEQLQHARRERVRK